MCLQSVIVLIIIIFFYFFLLILLRTSAKGTLTLSSGHSSRAPRLPPGCPRHPRPVSEPVKGQYSWSARPVGAAGCWSASRQTAPRGRRRLHALSEQLAGVTAEVTAAGLLWVVHRQQGRTDAVDVLCSSVNVEPQPFASTSLLRPLPSVLARR